MATQPLPEFDKLRQRTSQRLQAEDQTQSDAMKRRMAQMGGLNKGAFVKLEQQAQDQSAARKADALGQVDLAEAAEAQRRNEVIGAQQFQSAEAQKARDLQSQMFGKELDLKNRSFDFGKEMGREQLKIDKTRLDLEADAQQFNKKMAIDEANDPGGIFKGVLGKGGVPGAVQQIFGSGGGSQGSYFCTEMYKQGVITKKEHRSITRLLAGSILTRPQVLEYYLRIAPKVVAAARDTKYDWAPNKPVIDTVIATLDAGNLNLAQDLYIDFLKFMTQQFPETKGLWNEANLKAGPFSKIVSIMGLLSRRVVRGVILRKLSPFKFGASS